MSFVCNFMTIAQYFKMFENISFCSSVSRQRTISGTLKIGIKFVEFVCEEQFLLKKSCEAIRSHLPHFGFS